MLNKEEMLIQSLTSYNTPSNKSSLINKLMIAFCIISWVVIIPYIMFDIHSTLDNCETLLEEINVQRDF